MKIAIIGAGHVGGALARHWSKAGHDIVLALRDPGGPKYADLLRDLGTRGAVGTVKDAVKSAAIIVLAIPWAVTKDALSTAGDLKGKVVVDCTNPLGKDFSLLFGTNDSGAEQVSRWAPGARVCKAFNQTGAENMADAGYKGGTPVMFICGDDSEARRIVLGLAKEAGFDPVDAGPLNAARLLEPLAALWIHLAYKVGFGRQFAFGLLRR